jgi:hypothetical protein
MNSSDWVLDTDGELPTVETLRADHKFSAVVLESVTGLNFPQRNSTQCGSLVPTRLSLASPFTRVSYDYVFRSPKEVLTVVSS